MVKKCYNENENHELRILHDYHNVWFWINVFIVKLKFCYVKNRFISKESLAADTADR